MEPPFFEEWSHRRMTVERKWNIEHTGALNFFSDNFENILPPPLFEMILQKKGGLERIQPSLRNNHEGNG